MKVRYQTMLNKFSKGLMCYCAGMSSFLAAPSHFAVWWKGCKNSPKGKKLSFSSQQSGYSLSSLVHNSLLLHWTVQDAFGSSLQDSVWVKICFCSARSYRGLVQDEGGQCHQDPAGGVVVCRSCCRFRQHAHHVQVCMMRIRTVQMNLSAVV